MMFSITAFIVTALVASVAGIIAPPTVPRALGDVIVLQPPPGFVVRAGDPFALHYISKPSDDFVTYETEVGLQRVGHHNIRGVKTFHPTTTTCREAIQVPRHLAPGRYNLIVTDHRTYFDEDIIDNQALPTYRTQCLNVTVTVAHADAYGKDYNQEL
ncbi:hypothetical protein FRC12_025121 [Ceratobasidium sp. 428]|nr:hypothetical protein FRC12_025121 [Ceratobasidium sp. 428]